METTKTTTNTGAGALAPAQPISPPFTDATAFGYSVTQLQTQVESLMNLASKDFYAYTRTNNSKLLEAAWNHAWHVVTHNPNQAKAESMRLFIPPHLPRTSNKTILCL